MCPCNPNMWRELQTTEKQSLGCPASPALSYEVYRWTWTCMVCLFHSGWPVHSPTSSAIYTLDLTPLPCAMALPAELFLLFLDIIFSHYWIILSTTWKYAVVKKNPFPPHALHKLPFVLCSSFDGSLWRQLSAFTIPHPPSTPSFSPSSFLSTPIRFSLPPAHENCSCPIHQLHSCTRSKVRTFPVLNLLNYNLQNWSLPLFLNFLLPSHPSDFCDLE